MVRAHLLLVHLQEQQVRIPLLLVEQWMEISLPRKQVKSWLRLKQVLLLKQQVTTLSLWVLNLKLSAITLLLKVTALLQAKLLTLL